MFKKMGPGVLVAAAFIGPGTVTACTLAGVGFGFALLWALLLSIIATGVLQEMSARLGIITQNGLADAIKAELNIPWVRTLLIGIVLAAIVLGNAAYEAGNIGGATLGMNALFGTEHSVYYPIIIGTLAFVLLFVGSYKVLEKVFIALVLIMSLSFLLTAMVTKPDLVAILKGTFVPKIPEGSILNMMALVGTTVVPYNLFLHASLVSEKWKHESDLPYARKDTIMAIALGGLVSMAIVIAAASIPSGEITNVMDLAKGLEPLYGDSAHYFMGIGLFAAGITSAITAPLAAAYVANSCFGWKAGLKDKRFRMVWMFILGLGVFFLSFGIKPIEIIKFAQVANGILLPVIAIFLFWVVNKSTVMGKYTNSKMQNVLGFVIIVLALVLGVKSIIKVLGFL
ncbi:Nramp family divalent metal transporter [Maribacter polysiphoniae]|uniref:NRAMP (Natural resistance-associated macrophage protein)-like metal ion transporter n=1 Tax=Maribacter polysiphoniae TaxID=429344 RepID=A0A316DX40_9FLAO|nr:Nramp family divalent metal transporter [Maribacter polysiphoniae]MBD1262069.1 Nramp family divalent metal transporter [Maribacter polysiphoniae]PWK21759.1 NRAMP (natural resistance-associated macrophage protein)-like metal ion transporter [Maribacter polysiphoniae]